MNKLSFKYSTTSTQILFFILLLWNHPAFSQKLSPKDSIQFYIDAKQFDAAMKLATELELTTSHSDGAPSEQHAEALRLLSIIHGKKDNSKKAEQINLALLLEEKKLHAEPHKHVLEAYMGLSKDLLNNGYPNKAIDSLKIALQIVGSIYPAISEEMADFWLLFGEARIDNKDYSETEIILNKAISILKKLNLENSGKQAGAHKLLGIMYQDMAMREKALYQYKAALRIIEKVYPPFSDHHTNVYAHLTYAYSNLGNYDSSLIYNELELKCKIKKYGEESEKLARPFFQLGMVHMNLHNCFIAEQYMVKSAKLYEKDLGKNHPQMGLVHAMLNTMYSICGKREEAERELILALSYFKKTMTDAHPYMEAVARGLGLNYFGWKERRPEMEKQFRFWCSSTLTQIDRFFPSLSETEKGQYMEPFLVSAYMFYTHTVENRIEYPQLAGDMLNFHLNTKSVLLNTTARWKKRIQRSGDKKLFGMLNSWEENKALVGKLYLENNESAKKQVDSLEKINEAIEKQLSLRSENFGLPAERQKVDWKDIAKVLKPNEVAIEIIRFQKHGCKSVVTDTSSPQKRKIQVFTITDTIYYAALIISKDQKDPLVVLLPDGNDMEGKWEKAYHNAISHQIGDDDSFQRYWKRIGENLPRGTNRVYFSPDGIYHFINLNTLFNSKSKKYLKDELEIHYQTSSKDILPNAVEEPNNKLALLVGFPNYGESVAPNSTASSTRNENWPTPLAPLPGTKKEVEKLGLLLSKAGWEVQQLYGNDASESNLKEAYKPRVLHIATHGYFRKKEKESDNSLMQSGLLLAGAGLKSLSKDAVEKEDGILTAYEAMNLNLDNTDLVVLSACETGLGEVKDGEGVYGLQRAFKVAGAKSIIMSLWKVNDEATQELMVNFYKNWLGGETDGSASGGQTAGSAKAIWPAAPTANSKRSAFLKAQNELKAKYPNPYHWGAFVMVGE